MSIKKFIIQCDKCKTIMSAEHMVWISLECMNSKCKERIANPRHKKRCSQ